MILSEELVEHNKKEFLTVLDEADLPKDRVERFKEWLLKSDFFEAPASTKYHLACRGGLCQHTLNVLHCVIDLYNKLPTVPPIPYEDLLLAAILHDISKVNFYESYTRNEKQYCPGGTKCDDRGRTFNWVSVDSYKVREAADRFVFASHAQNAEFMARHFFDLSTEVSCAILHHMGPYDTEVSTGTQLSEIFSHHPLAALLHAADFLATHVLEGANAVE